LYIANHFWDVMDFSDSTYLQDKLAINIHYSSYIGNLLKFPFDVSKNSLEKFTTLVLEATPPLKEYLLEIIENSLYDPNSRLRDDFFYITVLKVIIKNEAFDPLLKERYREQLELALKNNPGDISNDFRFTTIEGKQGSLHTLPREYTLIMFYEPECPACEASLDYFSNNTVIELASKTFNMLAIYTGGNFYEWKKSAENFKPYWTVAHDNEMEITIERLYDRRPSPSFYLLDKNRTVILKDALTQDVVFEIATILKPQ
ncbi:MAG: DUF5106 domain-containing protein, partial [Bacteroidales bacterium]